jgi:hypothetical protein
MNRRRGRAVYCQQFPSNINSVAHHRPLVQGAAGVLACAWPIKPRKSFEEMTDAELLAIAAGADDDEQGPATNGQVQ